MKGQQLLISKTFSGGKKSQGQKFTSEYSFSAKDSADLTHRDYHITRRVGAKPRNGATPAWLLPVVLQAERSSGLAQERGVQRGPAAAVQGGLAGPQTQQLGGLQK